ASQTHRHGGDHDPSTSDLPFAAINSYYPTQTSQIRPHGGNHDPSAFSLPFGSVNPPSQNLSGQSVGPLNPSFSSSTPFANTQPQPIPNLVYPPQTHNPNQGYPSVNGHTHPISYHPPANQPPGIITQIRKCFC
ncbi:hypothetical protein K505DRAFT_322571, partial [Melanomma pulvis-pyrius CBS 109.77]